MYMQEVESLSTARSLGIYAQAAIYLQTMRAIFERLGGSQSWDNLITDHRERNHRLPALQDELNERLARLNVLRD